MTIIIGIAGGSGSGKTTLALQLAGSLASEGVSVLAQDHYYIDQSARFDGDGGSVNFDHPDSIDFALLAKHLSELREGRPVEVPIYDFPTHTRQRETVAFAPSEYVIVEGTLLLSQLEIRNELDLAIFVDASEPVRYERRLQRDVEERGRTPAGVKAQFDRQVKPMHDQFVEPSRAHAHGVVSGEVAISESLESALAMLSSMKVAGA